MSIEYRIIRLGQLVNGWLGYFRLADIKGLAKQLDEWVRRRLRMCYWKQWKKTKAKHDNLVRRGVKDQQAWQWANTRKSYWRTSNSPILAVTLSNRYFEILGYKGFTKTYAKYINF